MSSYIGPRASDVPVGTIGTQTVSANSIVVGSNVIVNSSSVFVGNSTVNTVANSSGFFNNGLGITPYNMRNRIINGDMKIDQRNNGSAQTVTASNIYCLDRWVTIGTVTNGSVQRVAADNVNQYAIRLLRSSGTSTGYIALHQTIETFNCFDLAAQTVTISFRARKGSAYSAGSTVQVSVITGSGTDQGSGGVTGGSWTGWAQLTPSVSGTLTTSFSTFTCSVAIPAGTNEVALFFSTGSFSGTGSSNDYLDITGVQLEVGSVATPFERRPYGMELALCQRYFHSTLNEASKVGFTGVGYGNYSIYGGVQAFPTIMRIQPTMTLYRYGHGADEASFGDGTVGRFSAYTFSGGGGQNPTSTFGAKLIATTRGIVMGNLGDNTTAGTVYMCAYTASAEL